MITPLIATSIFIIIIFVLTLLLLYYILEYRTCLNLQKGHYNISPYSLTENRNNEIPSVFQSNKVTHSQHPLQTNQQIHNVDIYGRQGINMQPQIIRGVDNYQSKILTKSIIKSDSQSETFDDVSSVAEIPHKKKTWKELKNIEHLVKDQNTKLEEISIKNKLDSEIKEIKEKVITDKNENTLKVIDDRVKKLEENKEEKSETNKPIVLKGIDPSTPVVGTGRLVKIKAS